MDCQRVPFEFAVFRRWHLRVRGFSVDFAVFSGGQLNLRIFRSRQPSLRIVRGWHLNLRFSGGCTSEFVIRGFHAEFAVFQWAAIEFAVSQYRILTKNKQQMVYGRRINTNLSDLFLDWSSYPQLESSSKMEVTATSEVTGVFPRYFTIPRGILHPRSVTTRIDAKWPVGYNYIFSYFKSNLT